MAALDWGSAPNTAKGLRPLDSHQGACPLDPE